MNSQTKLGFHAKGRDEYLQELRLQKEADFTSLERRLKDAQDPSERARLQHDLEELKTKYQELERRSAFSLF